MEVIDQTAFDVLLRDLADAREEYEAASQELSRANSRETSAMNALNKAQSAFDLAVAKIRSTAPPRSGWRQRTVRSVPVES